MTKMMNEPEATYIDVGALTLWIAAMAQVLPSIAALLSIVWLVIRIAESPTVQRMLGKRAWIKIEDKPNNED